MNIHDLNSINNAPSTHFVAYDGNGNVAALVNAADGTTSAIYEYGPFGEVIRATGPMAKTNPFRFSTRRPCKNKFRTSGVIPAIYAFTTRNIPRLARWKSSGSGSPE